MRIQIRFFHNLIVLIFFFEFFGYIFKELMCEVVCLHIPTKKCSEIKCMDLIFLCLLKLQCCHSDPSLGLGIKSYFLWIAANDRTETLLLGVS